MLGFSALGSAPLGSSGGGGAVTADQATSLAASLVGGVIRPVSADNSTGLSGALVSSVFKLVSSDQYTAAAATLTGGAVRPVASAQYSTLSATLLQDQGGASSNQYTDAAATLTGGVVRPVASAQYTDVSAALSGGVIRRVESVQYASSSAALTSTAIKSISAYQSNTVAASLASGVIKRMYSQHYSSAAASLTSVVKNFTLAIATEGAVVIEWTTPATYVSWGSEEDIMTPLRIVEGNKAPKIVTLYVVTSDSGYEVLDLTGCGSFTARARKIDESTGYPAGAAVAISATLSGAASNGQVQLDYSSSGLTAGIWDVEVHFVDGAAYQHVYAAPNIVISEPIPAP